MLSTKCSHLPRMTFAFVQLAFVSCSRVRPLRLPADAPTMRLRER